MDYYAHVLRDNTKNAYWGNLLRGQSVFPHYRIYRQALLDIFAERFAALQTAPEIRIGLSHLPRWLGARSAVAAGIVAYNIEKYVRKKLYPTLGQTLGFHPEFVRTQECARIEDLADLILNRRPLHPSRRSCDATAVPSSMAAWSTTCQSIEASSDPAFHGDAARHNPEELFVASLSSCHMLWYLHLCATNGIVVTGISTTPSAPCRKKRRAMATSSMCCYGRA